MISSCHPYGILRGSCDDVLQMCLPLTLDVYRGVRNFRYLAMMLQTCHPYGILRGPCGDVLQSCLPLAARFTIMNWKENCGCAIHNHHLERELWLRDLSRSQGLIYSSAQSFNLWCKNIYSAIGFDSVKVDGSKMGSKTLCMKVPLNCEYMIPRVVESEIEFKVIMNCSGKSIC